MGYSNTIAKQIYISISLILLAMLILPSSSAAAESGTSFDYPLKTKSIAKSFVEPAFEYGPGHRGTSFFAKPGTTVYATAEGQVIFAGRVAGSLHITLRHGKDFKSTYTNLATTTVKLGDIVSKGKVLGTTSSRQFKGEVNSFLFTIRYKDKYVDPMEYLTGSLIVREIRLGAFPKKSQSLLNKISRIERKGIENFLGFSSGMIPDGYSMNKLNKFINWMAEKSETALTSSAEEMINDFKKAYDTLEKMKKLSRDIAQYSVKNMEKMRKNAMEELRKLEKQFISQAKKAMGAAIEFSKLYAKYYKESLKISLEAARQFVNQFGDIALYPIKQGWALIYSMYDFVKTAGLTTSKLFNQYLQIEFPMLIREMIVPGSCLFWACSNPIEVKCNPLASFDVRSSNDGFKGTGNSVFVVSGIDTSGSVDNRGNLQSTSRIQTELFGYNKDETTYFSYAGVGKSFDKSDTHQDLYASAKNMDDQIKQFKKDNLDTELDLITHSLGGAVTGVWLAKYYDPSDRSYPEIGKVIMYAPPLNGTSFATAGEIARGGESGEAFMQGLGSVYKTANADSVKKVVENGDVEKYLNETGAMKKVEVHAIRLASDWVVSSGTQSVDGVQEIVLDSNSRKRDLKHPIQETKSFFSSHTEMVLEPEVISTTQYLLEGENPPCESPSSAIGSVWQASTVHSSEILLGKSIQNTNQLAPSGEVEAFLQSIS